MNEYRLKVRDLKYYVYEKVSIYYFIEDEYIDIYNGEFEDIPHDILEYEIKNIGAKRKGIVDINVMKN